MTSFVPADLDGERADKVVAVLVGVSRSVARRLVEQGGPGSTAAGSPLTRGWRGEQASSSTSSSGRLTWSRRSPFRGVHFDAHLLVVDKPPVVVHPGAGRRRGTLAAGLLAAYPELARGRAGSVRAGPPARRRHIGCADGRPHPEAHQAWRAALRRREIRRTYLTLVRGVPNAPSGTVDAPLDRDPRHPTRRAVRAGGKPAKPVIRVLASWAEAALLEVELETGRTTRSGSIWLRSVIRWWATAPTAFLRRRGGCSFTPGGSRCSTPSPARQSN